MTIGIVLGGGITDEGTLPRDVQKRVLKAQELLQKKVIRKIILCGGSTNKKFSKLTEALLMATLLLEKGVKKNVLLLEEKSKDTIGNAVFAKDIVLKKKLSSDVVVITSNYHLRRALSIFRHVFGSGYIVTGKASHGYFLHRFRVILREWEEKQLETLLLETIPMGDHKKALKFVYKHVGKQKKK
ncbi:YdcF family protein [Candidatus Woesearchaeota archaeon]|nr:YdcF family protein [Candidatus Woesearchaeota archaeon]